MAVQRPQWGWHELDPRWARRLVAESAVARGAWVVDIGAGRGAITAPLVAAGARVVAVELHPARARQLRERFGDAIVVVQTDARGLRLPRRPYHVVSSPPYAVTTPLMKRLLQPGSRLVTAHLVLQDQAARRWASPGAPGRNRWSSGFEVSLGPRVPRHVFRPEPAVDSRILVIRRRGAM